MTTARFITLIATFCVAFGVPFEPELDDAVLEKLPRQTFFRAQVSDSAAKTTNFTAICDRVEEYIRVHRAEADPRYLGYAQALLKPWWTSDVAPVPVLVLRATIKQSLHDFEGALRDLDLVLSREPQNAQAWLTRGTVLQVQGRLAEAKKACLPLFRIAPRHIAVASLASITSLNGEAQKSYELLRATLSEGTNISREEKVWMLTILAEIADGLGRSVDAEAHFREAIAINNSDVYLLAAYSDLLLNQGRHEETAALLEEKGRADALLLRRALARKEMRAPNASADISDLAARFDASRMRGDTTHGREEARFTLSLLGDARRAVEIARLNWQNQKEPADARVFLEAALAAKNLRAAEPVLAWIQSTGIENKHLQTLAKKLHE